mgnify:CR=1 FL=1
MPGMFFKPAKVLTFAGFVFLMESGCLGRIFVRTWAALTGRILGLRCIVERR